jgi:hypothetical protein
MADQILDFARKLDNGETIDIVQNQNSHNQENETIKNLKSTLQGWTDRADGKEESPRWKNVSTLIKEINDIVRGF